MKTLKFCILFICTYFSLRISPRIEQKANQGKSYSLEIVSMRINGSSSDATSTQEENKEAMGMTAHTDEYARLLREEESSHGHCCSKSRARDNTIFVIPVSLPLEPGFDECEILHLDSYHKNSVSSSLLHLAPAKRRKRLSDCVPLIVASALCCIASRARTRCIFAKDRTGTAAAVKFPYTRISLIPAIRARVRFGGLRIRPDTQYSPYCTYLLLFYSKST